MNGDNNIKKTKSVITVKQLDIGIDNAKAYNGTCFFTFEEVVKIMSSKNSASYDHH